MSQLQNQKGFSDLIRLGFIEPFKSPTLLGIYIASIFGVAGFIGAQIYLSFTLASQGPENIIVFFLARFGTTNLIWLPFLFYIFERWPLRIFVTFQITLSLITLGIIFFYSDTLLDRADLMAAFVLGLINTALPAGFWTMYHSLMTTSATDDNHGNDVAIADVAITLGNVVGSVFAGLGLVYMADYWFLSVCLILIFISIFILAYVLKAYPRQQSPYPFLSIYKAVLIKPRRTLNTIMQGASQLLVTFFAPVWMAIIGLGGLGTGLIMALQTSLKIIMSPIVGHMTNQSHGKEGIIGTSIKTAGWLPWIISQSHWLLLPSSILWFLGSQFYNIGIASRWYMERSTVYTAAREVCLGIGRIVAVVLLTPLLYLDPAYFFIGAALISALSIWSSMSESKSLTLKDTNQKPSPTETI